MPGLDIRSELKKNRPDGGTDLSKILQMEITLFPKKISDAVRESFYSELGILLGAGVDIKASLDLIESQQQKKMKDVVRTIKQKIISGASLSEALQLTGQFTAYEYASVHIGEETGRLNDVLRDLSSFYARKIKQRRQLINAVSYPLVIIMTSFGAVFFMLYFIVPMFSDIFKRFGGELPWMTKAIISLSASLTDNFYIIAAVIVGLVAFVWVNYRKEWFIRYQHQLISALPLIGPIVVRIQLARFCSSMALLTSAKIPLLRAIQLMRQMITFYPLQRSFATLEQDIINGKHLHESMSNFPVFDQRMIALLKVGEEVNQLDLFFQKLAQTYTEEAEHKTSVLGTFIEPFIIIFLGLVVGIILIAMYLPMFQISTNIGA